MPSSHTHAVGPAGRRSRAIAARTGRDDKTIGAHHVETRRKDLARAAAGEVRPPVGAVRGISCGICGRAGGGSSRRAAWELRRDDGVAGGLNAQSQTGSRRPSASHAAVRRGQDTDCALDAYPARKMIKDTRQTSFTRLAITWMEYILSGIAKRYWTMTNANHAAVIPQRAKDDSDCVGLRGTAGKWTYTAWTPQKNATLNHEGRDVELDHSWSAFEDFLKAVNGLQDEFSRRSSTTGPSMPPACGCPGEISRV